MSPDPTPRAHLVVLLPGGELRVALEGDRCTIGAEPDCTLALSRPGISGRHCLIQRNDEGGYELFDLWSEQGTWVNGQRVDAHLLVPGDQIGVGPVRLVFLSAKPAPPPVASTSLRDAPPEPAGVIPFAETDAWQRLSDQPVFETRWRDPSPPAPPAPRPSAAEGAAPVQRSWLEPVRSLGTGALTWMRDRFRAWRTPMVTPAGSGSAAVAPVVDRATLTDAMANATRYHPETFSDALVRSLRSTPYILASGAAHVLILLFLSLILTKPRIDRDGLPFHADLAAAGDIEAPEEWLEVVPPADVEVEEPSLEPEIMEPINDLPPTAWSESFGEEDAGESAGDLEATGLPFPAELGAGGGDALKGLGKGQGLNVGSRGFRRYVRGLRESGLDIVFVLDSTGSMGGVIEDTRRQIDDMIATLSALIPGFRIGFVTYRDRRDDYLTRAEALTPHAYEAVRFLDSIEADGGYDTPEAVLDGLREAANGMRWSPSAHRIVVIVGDAEPHAEDVDELHRLAASFATRKGTVHAIVTSSGSAFLASSPSPEALASFQAITARGRGVTVPLGSSRDMVREILRAAFDGAHGEGIDQALASVDDGWRTRHWRKRIMEGEPERILKDLQRKTTPYVLIRELGRRIDPALIPIYLEILTDASTPLGTRWAVVVLLERVLARIDTGGAMSRAARDIDPEASISTVRAKVQMLRQSLKAAGFPTELSRSSR